MSKIWHKGNVLMREYVNNSTIIADILRNGRRWQLKNMSKSHVDRPNQKKIQFFFVGMHLRGFKSYRNRTSIIMCRVNKNCTQNRITEFLLLNCNTYICGVHCIWLANATNKLHRFTERRERKKKHIDDIFLSNNWTGWFFFVCTEAIFCHHS